MRVLVVGGAGYIGSHMAKRLVEAGNEVVILDNLTTGHRKLAKYGQLIVGDLSDIPLIEDIFDKYDFDAVMHFAAASLVGESTVHPAKYYKNNVSRTLGLLDVMRHYEVNKFVFSSTAAIFGEPEYTPIDESHPKFPLNPYGRSKLMVENILEDYAQSYGLSAIALRYFNAAGADPLAELGEMHEPETHLIPLVLQAALGKREAITIFGEDYATPDGTCVRDYIHVNDLCEAHLLALNKLHQLQKPEFKTYNLGNGEGYSVREVIKTVEQVVAKDGFDVPVKHGERRKGDPAILVADSTLARKELNWVPNYADLKTIVQHAWAWEKTMQKDKVCD